MALPPEAGDQHRRIHSNEILPLAKQLVGIDCSHPYEGWRMYSAITHKSGRKNLGLVQIGTNKRRFISKAKYLLEVKLGRFLSGDEQADHIDEDCTNDDLDNLQVLSPLENLRKGVRHVHGQAKNVILVCPECSSEFSIAERNFRFKTSQGGTPCCSRSCGARFGSKKKK